MKQYAFLLITVCIYNICFSLPPGYSIQTGNGSITILDETFDNGTFSEHYEWSGDLTHFQFYQHDNNILLRSAGEPESSRTQVRVPSDAAYGSWEFYFRQEFTSSNLNRSFVFLIADREDLNYLDGSPVSGYALRTGENGNPKKIRLVRFDNGSPTVILDTGTILEEGTGYRIRVERTHDGIWTVYSSEGYFSSPDTSTGSVIDNTYTNSTYFGLLLRYTAANHDRFYFDDFRIVSTPRPLQAEYVRTMDPSTLLIGLNRPPDPATVDEQAFHFASKVKPTRTTIETERTIRLDFDQFLPGGPDTLTVEGLCDPDGICSDPFQPLPILVASPATPGDVVINEIMFNPLRKSADLYPGQSEYIELYNRQPYALSLEGFHIRDHPDLHPGVSKLEPADSRVPWIPAGGYMVLYPEPDGTDFSSSRIAGFFGLPDSMEQFTVRFNRSTLGLPASGRDIVLSTEDGTILDRVAYRPEWHNPNLIDTRGIALERVHPGSGSNNPDNWSSSVVPEGGTPGKTNSVMQLPGRDLSEVGISFEPNPFSPDSDGHNDRLFIHYKLDQTGYLIRVKIFDRYGRQVKNLAGNEPAGMEGHLIWDGRRDNGQSNRIGIYIVWFEAYNSSTGRRLRFQKPVVLARQL